MVFDIVIECLMLTKGRKAAGDWRVFHFCTDLDSRFLGRGLA